MRAHQQAVHDHHCWAHQARKKSVLPEQIHSIERTERPDGSGNLRLILGYEKDGDGDTVTKAEDLMAIPEVRKVENLLMDLKRRAA